MSGRLEDGGLFMYDEVRGPFDNRSHTTLFLITLLILVLISLVNNSQVRHGPGSVLRCRSFVEAEKPEDKRVNILLS